MEGSICWDHSTYDVTFCCPFLDNKRCEWFKTCNTLASGWFHLKSSIY